MDKITNFQTPIWCCKYMKSLIPSNVYTILEPTPGQGNLVSILKKDYKVISPTDFWKLKVDKKFDCIVMNPPFTPMKLGYKFLYKCMELSDNIIALMPWLTIINSEQRTKDIIRFGLKSITHLPRKTFTGSRVQTCILQMQKDFGSDTKFIFLDKKYDSINSWLN